jgi:hypothetical protein
MHSVWHTSSVRVVLGGCMMIASVLRLLRLYNSLRVHHLPHIYFQILHTLGGGVAMMITDPPLQPAA